MGADLEIAKNVIGALGAVIDVGRAVRTAGPADAISSD